MAAEPQHKPRKRDRLRRFLGVQTSASPSSSSPDPANLGLPGVSPAQNSSLLPSRPAPANLFQFSSAALQTLDPVERALVEKYCSASSGLGDAQGALESAYTSAVQAKKISEEGRWKVSFRGREVVLRDEAEKLVKWIEKFKEVGDVVANVDPVHIGLPWAGIRAILKVMTSESEMMAGVLAGMTLGMYIVNRLRAYLEYFARIPEMDTKRTLEMSLVKMYAILLAFLQDAVEAYEKGTVKKIWHSLWTESEIGEFEKKCNTWALHIGLDIDNCDRDLDRKTEDDARAWRVRLDAELRDVDCVLRDVQDSLTSLHRKHDLAKLAIAQYATYDSFEEQHSARCLPGTSVNMLRQILDWAGDDEGKRIFWLCGMAGTGKSTISRTVAHVLDQQHRLGASFFFKRGEGDRGNASRFFPTIARQLADIIPGVEESVAGALEDNSLLSSRGLRQQFVKLLLQPLRKITQASAFILVVDALDECENDEDIRTILTLLAKLKGDTCIRLRLFITSRPELPIRLEFRAMSTSLHQDVVLEEVQAPTIKQDIRAYFEHRFAVIKSEHALDQPYEALPDSWPSSADIEILVQSSVPLFIAAFTICEFVSEMEYVERLETFLQQQQRRHVLISGLEQTYLSVLTRLIWKKGDRTKERILDTFRYVVGSIVIVADSLSFHSLRELLDTTPATIEDCLKGLHSVLDIPSDTESPIRLFHLSFREFLTDRRIMDRNPFHIDEAQTHRELATNCLRLLNKELKKDLCEIGRVGALRRDIGNDKKAITAGVAYACTYWVSHLSNSEQILCDDGPVHKFLLHHFLHWLEALSWLDSLSQAIADIRSLLKLSIVIDRAPLQAYSSALIFSPEMSVVRRVFGPELTTSGLSRLPGAPKSWNAEILKMWSKATSVIAISPDGQLLATASPSLLSVHEATTGDLLHELSGAKFSPVNSEVSNLIFGPDQQTVAFAVRTIVWQWNTTAHTGGVRRLGEHAEDVCAMAVAAPVNKSLLASASHDKSVQLWDMDKVLQVHTLGVDFIPASLAFSLKGTLLAVASATSTVSIWDVSTGHRLREIKYGHVDIGAVVFSEDSLTLSCALCDGTTRLSSVETGLLMETLQGPTYAELESSLKSTELRFDDDAVQHRMLEWMLSTRHDVGLIEYRGLVKAVGFHSANNVLATAGDDGFVRLWNADLHSERSSKASKSHKTTIVSVVISPNGRLVASTSDDGITHLWDMATGSHLRTFQGVGRHNCTVFSSDSNMLASIASHDAVFLWKLDGAGLRIFRLHGDSHRCDRLSFSSDCTILSAGKGHYESQIWWIHTEKTRTLGGQLTFSNSSKMIASVSAENMLCLYDLTDDREYITTIREHMGAIAFSLDDHAIASGTPNGRVCLHRITGHKTSRGQFSRFNDRQGRGYPREGLVTALVFSANGSMIASKSYGSFEIIIYDVGTGVELYGLRTEKHEVRSMIFIHDDRFLKTDYGYYKVRDRHLQTLEGTSDDFALFDCRYPSIARNGESLLCLPGDYLKAVGDVHENTLVLGHDESGTLSFFEFDPSWNRV